MSVLRRHWKRLAAIAVLVAAAAVLVWVKWPRDSAAPASVGEALQDFRSGAGEAQDGLPGLPRFGVYVYATRGSEALDTAVIGSTHPYRGKSTITIEPSACGVQERWQVLITRWNESTTCQMPDGLQADSVTEHHEFFGTVSAISYPCRDARQPLPESYRVGLRWTVTCGNSEGSVRVASAVVASESIEIDGERVPAYEIRSRVAFDGEVSGASIVSDWRRGTDGLLLRRAVDTRASVEVIGGGSYDESYSLAIMSTVPQE